MGVINVLPLPVINKIAAGEVIERPASVVKELVENSLDAAPSFVTIEVEDGGKKLIRVTDDGFGMALDDLAFAFSSHATSKLKGGDDLFFITTLGFRGEALSSIGAVSHARIVSRLRGAVEGGEVQVNGGSPEPARPCASPEGTMVEVANLFFNVPARRKFLKSAGTEIAHIVDLVSRVALANPGVGFRLTHNGREAVNVAATDDRRRRLGDLYGRELADALVEVDSGEGPVRVTGFGAPPIHCRSNTKMQLTFVNGRFVRDRSISHAVSAAYEGLLTRGRYPVVFLLLQIDPREVDVNVHPTKIEVRFHQGQMVYVTVRNAVHQALSQTDLEPVFEPPPLTLSGREPPLQQHLPDPGRRSQPATPFDRPVRGPTAERAAAEPAYGPPARHCHQFHNAYIVDERPDGLAIVDQHALHERIIFEEIQARLNRAGLESQRLLIPAVVSLSRGETALLLSEKENLAQLGIELAEFGPDSLAVNALPAVLAGRDPTELLHECLAELSGDARDTPLGEKRLAMAKLIACKAAVKAGEPLTDSEMRSLLEKGEQAIDGDTCPHGRPVSIFLPFDDLERQFKRK